MFGSHTALPSASELCVSAFTSPNPSPFNLKLLALFTLRNEGSVVEGSTFNWRSLSPFSATLLPRVRAKGTGSSQLIENTATLSPAFATLTGFVTANPFVCHSYKKTPGVGGHSSPLPPQPPLLPLPPRTRHNPADLPTKSFTIRTSEKCARNSFRMCTSKTKDLKLFRMNTYKKTPGGRGPLFSFTSSTSYTSFTSVHARYYPSLSVHP
jgi:hypothetical protein